MSALDLVGAVAGSVLSGDGNSVPIRPTRALTLMVGDVPFDEWTAVEMTRSLDDISGSFRLALRDATRSRRTWIAASAPILRAAMKAGQPVAILIHGRLVLRGYLDEVGSDISDSEIALEASGRDRTGDLVDCAATVDGPAELKGVTLKQAIERVVAPFGISVRDDVGLKTARNRSIDVGETAMSAIEKWARQEGVLITSDGVGSVLITRTGATRVSDPLMLPGTVAGQSWRVSLRERYSHYIVKGQASRAGGARGSAPGLDGTAEPLPTDPSAIIAAQTGRETLGTAIRGDAVDEEVGRYRPIVMMARTEATATGASTQAQWAMRVARARSESLEHTVSGWTMSDGQPWRLNVLAGVIDAYAGIAADRLIAGVRFTYGDGQAEQTTLRLVSPEAYDLEPVADRRVNRKARAVALDGTAERLTP